MPSERKKNVVSDDQPSQPVQHRTWQGEPPPPTGAPVPGLPGVNYAPSGAYPITSPEHPQSTMVLIFSILGLVGLGFMLPVAWYMGAQAKKEIDGQHQQGVAAYRWDGSQLKIGYLIGKWGTIVGGIMAVVSIIVMILFFVFFAATVSNLPTEPFPTTSMSPF